MGKAFDVETLTEVLGLEREDIVELLNDFREYLGGMLPDLEKAVAASDFAAIRSLTHALKGSSGNLRISDIYEVAKKMQDASETKQAAVLKSLMSEMKHQGERFMAESQAL